MTDAFAPVAARLACNCGPGCSSNASTSTTATCAASAPRTCCRTTVRGRAVGPAEKPGDIHWGWESPNSHGARPLRRALVGGRRRAYPVSQPTASSRPRVDDIVAESRPLPGSQRRRVGRRHSREVPALDRRRAGPIWAPHYIGPEAVDGPARDARVTGNEQALEIVVNAARWFSRWTRRHVRRTSSTTSSTSRRAACSSCGPTCTASPAERAPRADGPLRPPPAVRPAARRRRPAHQPARQLDHPRGARRRPRLRGHGRAALARHRRGVLALRGHRAGRVLHRRADLGRVVDRPRRAVGPARRQHTRSTAPSTT